MFQFRQAVRADTKLLIGIAGPSSSGKTYSALRLATGLAEGGPIVAVDTESGRMLHYADDFEFQHGELHAPFRPSAYQGALQAAKDAGAKVIIVDSMSHEHEGEGGILEMHEEELERMAGDDFRKRERVKFTAWIKPKREHNKFVNAALQLDVHVIICFRAKEKLKMVKNERGAMEPTPQGWQPICSDRFEYEMTALLMLPPGSEGKPDTSAEASKIQRQHQTIFEHGRQIDESMGRALADWSRGSGEFAQPAGDPDPLEEARAVAVKGTDEFRKWWNLVRVKAQWPTLKPHLEELQALATEADTAGGQEDEDPFPTGGEAPNAPPAAEADQEAQKPGDDAQGSSEPAEADASPGGTTEEDVSQAEQDRLDEMAMEDS